MMNTPGHPLAALSHDDVLLLTAEYEALRAETLKRIEIQHQLLTVSLVAPGTALGLGLNLHDPFVILLYPFFGLFLAAAWAHNEYRKRQIGLYVKQHIEEQVGANRIGWETFLKNPKTGKFPYQRLASSGLLIGTSAIALVVGIFEGDLQMRVPAWITAYWEGTPLPPLDLRLVIVAVVALVSTILTILVVQAAVRYAKEARQPDPEPVTVTPGARTVQ
jgi:hypothetical protein